MKGLGSVISLLIVALIAAMIYKYFLIPANPWAQPRPCKQSTRRARKTI